MRIKRGLNSMRVRRRQSDAKWRASVASCYDTLKFVIPDSGRIPKRKISKAVILQNTDKHIDELEKTLAKLLTHEASACGKTIMWKNGTRLFQVATMAHIRKDFEEKQAELFEQTTQGRRKYSMLSDIEDEILHMAANTNKLTVLDHNANLPGVSIDRHNKENERQRISAPKIKILRKELTKPMNEPQAHSTPRAKKVRRNSHTDSVVPIMERKLENPTICERLPYTSDYNTTALTAASCTEDYLHSAPITSLNTPSKMCYVSDSDLFSPVGDYGDNVFTPVVSNRHVVKPAITSPSLSKVAKQLTFVSDNEPSTPARPSCSQEKMTEMGSLFGFTPIKLPSPDLSFTPLREPLLEMMENTPAGSNLQLTPRTTYPPQTPRHEEEESDGEETKSLLCLETFDLLEDSSSAPEWERTPSKKTSPETNSTPASRNGGKENCKKKFSRNSRKNRGDRAPKCKKNLESLYCNKEDENEKTMPVITGVFDKDTNCADFDGYFLFYRQVVGELTQHMSREEIASPSVVALVSKMWSDMSSDDRETLATLAALEGSQDSNSSSGLSDDLQDLDVKPLDSSQFIHAERLGLFCNGIPAVPDTDAKIVAATVDKVLQRQSNQEVPSCILHDDVFTDHNLSDISEEMAIINLELDKSNTDFPSCPSLNSSQMVPEMNIVKSDVLLSSTQIGVSYPVL